MVVAESELEVKLPALLDSIHADMLSRNRDELITRVRPVTCMEDLISSLDQHCICIAPFCGDQNCEDQVKEASAK
ncbi:unnamed protein product [Protopolystoma xenopodis]|uniref:Uncharacterized protein n=1 Tax=Protopolystoma xenopodis TaxID=117903 RepID=A0A448X889_9PLAT|nr:unnamed protein product [Protopolystoma xenopodis]